MIDQHVTSLEISKRMKELGFEQKSIFAYAISGDEDDKEVVELIMTPGTYSATFYSAYLSSEMGEILPGNIDGDIFVTQKGMLGRLWYCSMKTHNIDKDGLSTKHQENADTECNARGLMLIYLRENGII